jgi:hypothetical protein
VPNVMACFVLRLVDAICGAEHGRDHTSESKLAASQIHPHSLDLSTMH